VTALGPPSSGKQIKLFLIDGTPGGLTTAEITNWTGHVLSARRSDLADLLKRDEAQRTGVYVLLGDDEAAIGNTRCYIGEADVIADRLRSQQRDKDFWDRVVVITSKDANLTKAHGRYLEARLIDLATHAGRVTLENGTVPTVPALPEADASDMDYFLAQLQIVLPVLGVNVIRVPLPKPLIPSSGQTTESPIFHLRNAKVGVDARAQQIDGEFTMLAGSSVVGSWHGIGKERARKQAVAAVRSEIEVLNDRAKVLGSNSLAKLDTVSLLRGMVDVNTSYGSGIIQLWRVGSASAHGYYWADQMRDNPGQSDHQGFHTALYGATMFLNDAMMLHHRRATTG